MSYDGPTTCSNDGDYQHHYYTCNNGKPLFYVKDWINSDGSMTVVPDELCSEGANDAYASKTFPTLVQMGAGGVTTFWKYSKEAERYVDTGEEATPLVVIGSDGKMVSDGYNPGTGQWLTRDPAGNPVPGVAPVNAAQIPQVYANALAAVEALGELLVAKPVK